MPKHKHNHSILVFCPFCDADLAEVHQIVRRSNAPSQPVTLCPNCGEILLYTEENFRRPSEDEYLEIYENTTIREARDAFVKIKNGTEEYSNVTRMWKLYAEDRLIPTLQGPEPLNSDELYDLLQDVFFSGASMVAAYAKHHAAAVDSRDELMAKLFILELELNAYAEWTNANHTGDHYHGKTQKTDH